MLLVAVQCDSENHKEKTSQLLGIFLQVFFFSLFFFCCGGHRREHRYHVVETGRVGPPGKLVNTSLSILSTFFSWPRLSPLWNKLMTSF